MSVMVEPLNRQQTRDLILSVRGGILTKEFVDRLDACLGFATHLWGGTINDKLVCAWGLIPPSLLSDEAYLWLWHTDEIEENKFLFVRYSQRVIEEMLKIYPTIVGKTLINSTKSIRWLRWLGAKYGEPNGDYLPFRIIGKT